MRPHSGGARTQRRSAGLFRASLRDWWGDVRSVRQACPTHMGIVRVALDKREGAVTDIVFLGGGFSGRTPLHVRVSAGSAGVPSALLGAGSSTAQQLRYSRSCCCAQDDSVFLGSAGKAGTGRSPVFRFSRPSGIDSSFACTYPALKRRGGFRASLRGWATQPVGLVVLQFGPNGRVLTGDPSARW
jgi:hypothetical protein